MSETILMEKGGQITKLRREEWENGISNASQNIKGRLSFMSDEHHLVRNFVVKELPRVGKPLSPEFISEKLNLPVARVNTILDELEKHLTFLFRNGQGAVAWAYPVTVDSTPHHVTFGTGEQVYAA
jgi:hypothetical protein